MVGNTADICINAMDANKSQGRWGFATRWDERRKPRTSGVKVSGPARCGKLWRRRAGKKTVERGILPTPSNC